MEVLQSQLEWTYTYYAHDANGQLMGIYKHEFDEGSGTNAYVLNSTSLGNPIYGSDRLGMHQSDLVESFNFSGQELNGEIVATGSNYTAISSPVNTNFAREVGKRAYELKNHLGNVLVTVSDRKVASGNTGLIDSYTADVLSYSDYYPFGMEMPGRKGGTGYRFGFQGQEKDDELKGEGNSVNYKYRMHDPRLGRFFAVDPLAAEYPHNSVYAFSENRVIDAIELEGLEAFLVHGTWADSNTWMALEKEDYKSIRDATGNNKFIKDKPGTSWTGNNLDRYRDDAAWQLYKTIKENMIEGEPLTIIGHSHGGNVGVLAANYLAEDGIIVDYLITINTPVREYQLDECAAANHVQIYHEGDPVQANGGKTLTLDYQEGAGKPYTGDFGKAGREFDNATNIKLDDSKSWKNFWMDFHDSHNKPELWREKLKEALQQYKDSQNDNTQGETP